MQLLTNICSSIKDEQIANKVLNKLIYGKANLLFTFYKREVRNKYVKYMFYECAAFYLTFIVEFNPDAITIKLR